MQKLLEKLNDALYRLALRRSGVVRVPRVDRNTKVFLPALYLSGKVGDTDFGALPRAMYGSPDFTFDKAVEVWAELARLASKYSDPDMEIRDLIRASLPSVVGSAFRDSYLPILVRFLVVASWSEGAKLKAHGPRIEVRRGPVVMAMDSHALGSSNRYGSMKFFSIKRRLTHSSPDYSAIIQKPGTEVGKVGLHASSVMAYLKTALPGLRREIEAVYGAALHRDCVKPLVARYEIVGETTEAGVGNELASLLELNNLIGRKT
jgi:hypothetical protein